LRRKANAGRSGGVPGGGQDGAVLDEGSLFDSDALNSAGSSETEAAPIGYVAQLACGDTDSERAIARPILRRLACRS
jgi:hypothetical protein